MTSCTETQKNMHLDEALRKDNTITSYKNKGINNNNKGVDKP